MMSKKERNRSVRLAALKRRRSMKAKAASEENRTLGPLYQIARERRAE